ncbi:unnamed protein product, partial [Polarella glacialis]
MCLALLSLDFGPRDLPSARTAAPMLKALEEAEDAEASGPSSKPVLTSFFQTQQQPQPSIADDGGVGGVLVVAPLSLIRQWAAEVELHFPESARPSVHEYYGSGRNRTAEQLRSFGVVLTTYNTLSSEKENGTLMQVYWRRIILDEAHSIKNRCSRPRPRLHSACEATADGSLLR